MKNIVLIGMPGTGKSTVGVILAKRLGYDFLDADILIATREGRTLPRIIDEEGLDGFLAIEGRIGGEIHCTGTVIATGGSMVFSPEAMANLRANGVVVWLETPVELLEERLANNSREDRGVAAPAEMSVSDIYALREPLYTRYADIRILCENGVDRVVAQVRQALEGVAL